MKFSIGDKVRIKSKEWYDANKDKYGSIKNCGFIADMSRYCGKEARILHESDGFYTIDLDDEFYFWTNEMFEL